MSNGAAATADSLSLMGRLRPVLALARQRPAVRRVTLADLVEALGPGSTPLAAMLVALPFVSPMSLGPIAMPASALTVYLGWRVATGREDFPIPARYLGVPVPPVFLRLLRRGIVVLARRGRWHLAQHGSPSTEAFRRSCGRGMTVGAALLAVPVPFLPLTNTFPALAVVAFALAATQNGRRSYVVGWICNVVGALVFVALAAAFMLLGWDALSALAASIT